MNFADSIKRITQVNEKRNADDERIRKQIMMEREITNIKSQIEATAKKGLRRMQYTKITSLGCIDICKYISSSPDFKGIKTERKAKSGYYLNPSFDTDNCYIELSWY